MENGIHFKFKYDTIEKKKTCYLSCEGYNFKGKGLRKLNLCLKRNIIISLCVDPTFQETAVIVCFIDKSGKELSELNRWLEEYSNFLLQIFHSIQFSCRKVMSTNLDTGDGGQSGGRVHIAWCFPRQHSFIKSISVSTQMRCQHQ